MVGGIGLVDLEGDVGATSGWVIDFADIAAACEPVRLELDHRYLNEIDGLENPTSEVIAQWIWRRLAPGLPGLCLVTVQETCNAGVDYDGR